MSEKYSTLFPSVRQQVSDAEWETRVNLAACYRLIDKYGMSDLIYNHITARVCVWMMHLTSGRALWIAPWMT